MMKQFRFTIGRTGKSIFITIAVGILLAAIVFGLWWMGCFLPTDIDWREKSFLYEGVTVELSNRNLCVNQSDNSGTQTCVWKSDWDWFVQDVQVFDINCDGVEELVMLVWKHGSYGEHLPFWTENNDIRLEQHIFIYQWSKEERLRSIWMSSALEYEVRSIAQCEKNMLLITDVQSCSKVWYWQGFGLKLAGDAKERTADFLCAGDNLIHPWILDANAADDSGLYENIRTVVAEADFATVNQETIYVKDENLISDFPKFGTPLSVGEELIAAGFDGVSLANNHTLDYGTYGIETTVDFYDKNQIVYCGVNPVPDECTETEDICERAEDSVTFVDVNGIRIALLGYTYGTNGIPSPKEQPYLVERFEDEDRMIAQIDYARIRADAVIVYAHWGEEYSFEVSDEQRRLSDIFLAHGVDVVIGTHPHVLQPYEVMTGEDGHQMLVYYSLGNLISGQEQCECMVGGLAKFTLHKSTDGKTEITAYSMDEVVTHQSGGRATTYLMHDYSMELAKEHRIKEMRAYIETFQR